MRLNQAIVLPFNQLRTGTTACDAQAKDNSDRPPEARAAIVYHTLLARHFDQGVQYEYKALSIDTTATSAQRH